MERCIAETGGPLLSQARGFAGIERLLEIILGYCKCLLEAVLTGSETFLA